MIQILIHICLEEEGHYIIMLYWGILLLTCPSPVSFIFESIELLFSSTSVLRVVTGVTSEMEYIFP